MEPVYLTIPEVAQLLELGERTVYELACQGRLGGASKVGGQWHCERHALIAWLERGGEAAEVVVARKA